MRHTDTVAPASCALPLHSSHLRAGETLEKVTEKVDKLTVFGGLDGVLQDTVKININAG